MVVRVAPGVPGLGSAAAMQCQCLDWYRYKLAGQGVVALLLAVALVLLLVVLLLVLVVVVLLLD